MELALVRNTVQRVMNWNAARYEQVFNYDLALALLKEETEELFGSDLHQDIMDAVGDITFVSIGIMWKLGFNSDTVSKALVHLQKLEYHEVGAYTIDTHLALVAQLQNLDEVQLEQVFSILHYVVTTLAFVCIPALNDLGLKNHFFELLNIICDSNDTKSLPSEKVDASIKANTSKGKNFVPPTRDLITLYNKVKKHG